MRRQQWQCGDGVPLARENSSAIKIVPRIICIVVPRIVPKPWRIIVFFEEVLALVEVLFGGTKNSTIK